MHASAIFHRCHSLPPFLMVLVVALLAALPLTAHAQLTVSDIRVEARADDAVQAQLLAIERGQRQGLERLVQQLAASSGQPAPSLQGVDVDRTVASFEILDESIATGSYAATMAVTYNEAEVRSLMGGSVAAGGVIGAATAAPPALIVPLWETGNGLLLWERGNLWKDAVDRGVVDSGLAPLVVPLGDLQDQALLDADQAVRGDAQALGRLGARYGLQSVVLARLIGSGAPGAPLEIDAQRVGGVAEAAYRSPVRQTAGESLDASLTRAAREMQTTFDQRARERSMVPSGPGQAVVLDTPVTDPLGWGQLLAVLDGLPEVSTVEVRSLTRRAATLDVAVAGGAERLRQSLGPFGWNLIDDGADRWRLERGGPASAAPSPR